MWANTHNAMKHFRNRHPEVAEELEHSWRRKLELKADANRLVNDAKRKFLTLLDVLKVCAI